MTMKSFLSVAVLAGWLASLVLVPARGQGPDDGLALAIIYDTSGSMKDPVADAHGGLSPKYVIANRALARIAGELEAFRTRDTGGGPRSISAALYTFAPSGGREVIPLGPFHQSDFTNWVAGFHHPDGNTPLGLTMRMAGDRLLDSPITRKHLLIITDGLNTRGPDPSVVLPQLQRRAAREHHTLATHFVAFDVDSRQFKKIREQGATVVGAADEARLNTQLDFILQRQILLEDEEPKK